MKRTYVNVGNYLAISVCTIAGIRIIGRYYKLGAVCASTCEFTVDLNVKAFNIVRLLAGEATPSQKSVRSRKGGKIGGPARAQALSPERRKEIAIKASSTRWKNTGEANTHDTA